MVTIDFFNLNLDELLIENHSSYEYTDVVFKQESIFISDEELIELCNQNPTLSDDGRFYLESLLQFVN
jgi:hypothetical protein